MFFSYLYNINGYMSEWYEKKKHILASLVLGTNKSCSSRTAFFVPFGHSF